MRLGQADCQIGYGPIVDDGAIDLLFRDFVLPISSRVNLDRTSQFPARARLEGFPLLHLDFYKDDPARLSWPDWIAANDIARTAPERGIRFQRITAAVDAVLANAGITLCGLALLSDAVEDGSIALPYPISTGIWSTHAFLARFPR